MTFQYVDARVVQIVQTMQPGGIETLALDLMADAGIGGIIVSLSHNADSLVGDWPAIAPFRTRLIGLNQESISHISLQRRLFQLLRRIRPQSVILHHIGPLVHGGIAARLAGIRSIVHIEHDAWHYQDNARHRQLSVLCERLIRPTRVAVSTEVADRVHSFLPSAKFCVIPPGIDTKRFALASRAGARSRLGFNSSWRMIGSVGRLVPVKGQKYLIEAMASLPADTHLALVGDGPDREALASLTSRMSLENRVHFLGQRSDPENILPALDVFCLPSLSEGLPRAVLEAQSCGITVVASDVGALRQAVAPSGRVVPAMNAGALADALAEALADKPPASATRDYVVERFSLLATVAALRPLVTSLQ